MKEGRACCIEVSTIGTTKAGRPASTIADEGQVKPRPQEGC